MKFSWCTIKVKDLNESLDFYQKIAGLPLENRFTAGPDTEIAFLGNGETKVELVKVKGYHPQAAGEDISLGFEVDSVESMLDTVKENNIPVHSGPIQPSPHYRFFYVLDPNGVKVQFVENIK